MQQNNSRRRAAFFLLTRCDVAYILNASKRSKENQMHHFAKAAFHIFDHIQRGLMWLFNIKE